MQDLCKDERSSYICDGLFDYFELFLNESQQHYFNEIRRGEKTDNKPEVERKGFRYSNVCHQFVSGAKMFQPPFLFKYS